MAVNNSINAPLPISSTFGGTGVSIPTNHGIMVSNGTNPMSSLALSNNEVLLGSTGNAPVHTRLNAGANITFDQTVPNVLTINAPAPTGFAWEAINTFPVDGQPMLPFTGYISTSTDIFTNNNFLLPASADVSVGDEFYATCYGTDTTGFYVFGPSFDTGDSIWQGFDITQPPRGTRLRMSRDPILPCVGSVLIICVDNSGPIAQYLVLSATGPLLIGS